MDKINQIILISCFSAMIFLEFIGHPVPTTIALIGGFYARHIIGDNNASTGGKQ